MASDYEAIARENRLKYGTEVEVYGKTLLANLYSDRTHFIYELLQNAEDAGATQIAFGLRRDALEVRHDGRPFNDSDVRGICGIVDGTKHNDDAAIGRFGIGFKSVYAYTRLPEVHSGDEHFCIEHYVIPRAAVRQTISGRDTVFIFPFNHLDISPSIAFEEISRRLRNLGGRTLLFLQSLQEISWQIEGIGSGQYLRDVCQGADHQRVTLVGKGIKEEIDEQWLVFSRFHRLVGKPDATVKIAFLLGREASGQSERIVPIHTSRLFVFFPTEKETRLGFLIQGPYHTTPARDNVPADDPWNQDLIRSTSALLSNSLLRIRNNGLLTAGCLNALPLRQDDFPEFSLFRPIYNSVKKSLQSDALLPTLNGPHAMSRDVRLANGAAIRDLLDENQLSLFFNSQTTIRWIASDITEDRTSDLWKYLRHVLGIEEVNPESFARGLTEQFVSAQSDEWVAKFYTFLNGQESLWRRGRTSWDRGPLRDKPFIRLADGTHVVPFDKAEKPSAYFGEHEQLGLPIVRHSIAQLPEARQFLVRLGITEPDLVAQLVDVVLPKYTRDGSKPELDEHLRHITLISEAFGTASNERKETLRQRLKSTLFFLGSNPVTHQRYWATPSRLYLRNPILEMYFAGNTETVFLGNHYSALAQELPLLGVSDRVRSEFNARDERGFVVYKNDHADHGRGLNGFDPTSQIDGIDYALSHPTIKKSEFIWNTLLRPNAQHIAGEVEESRRQTFEIAERSTKTSQWGKLVRESAWLPSPNGGFVCPNELRLDDLPDDFIRDQFLARQLGMKADVLSEHAGALGLTADEAQLIQSNLEDVKEFLRTVSSRRRRDGNMNPVVAESNVEFNAALTDAFSHPNDQDEIDQRIERGDNRPVPNPYLRRERVGEEIASSREGEPISTERFKRIPTKVWEAKNPHVRIFLEQEYDGKCQICDSTFMKRNGRPYFEGMYLVSTTEARWIDREGNALCLCASCCAKLQHGPVTAENITGQIKSLKLTNEGGGGNLTLKIRLCDEDREIRYSERHLLDLQTIVDEAEKELVGLKQNTQRSSGI